MTERYCTIVSPEDVEIAEKVLKASAEKVIGNPVEISRVEVDGKVGIAIHEAGNPSNNFRHGYIEANILKDIGISSNLGRSNSGQTGFAPVANGTYNITGSTDAEAVSANRASLGSQLGVELKTATVDDLWNNIFKRDASSNNSIELKSNDAESLASVEERAFEVLKNSGNEISQVVIEHNGENYYVNRNSIAGGVELTSNIRREKQAERISDTNNRVASSPDHEKMVVEVKGEQNYLDVYEKSLGEFRASDKSVMEVRHNGQSYFFDKTSQPGDIHSLVIDKTVVAKQVTPEPAEQYTSEARVVAARASAEQIIVRSEDLANRPFAQVHNNSVRSLRSFDIDATAEFQPNPTVVTDINGKETTSGIIGYERNEAGEITAVKYVNPKDSADKYAVQKFAVKDGLMILPGKDEAMVAEINSVVDRVVGDKKTISLAEFDSVLKDSHTYYSSIGQTPDIYNSNTGQLDPSKHIKLADNTYQKVGNTERMYIVEVPTGQTVGFEGSVSNDGHLEGAQYSDRDFVVVEGVDPKTKEPYSRKLDIEYAIENLRDATTGEKINVEALPKTSIAEIQSQRIINTVSDLTTEAPKPAATELTLPAQERLRVPVAFSSEAQMQELGQRLIDSKNALTNTEAEKALLTGERVFTDKAVGLQVSDDGKTIKIMYESGLYKPVDATPDALERKTAEYNHFRDAFEDDVAIAAKNVVRSISYEADAINGYTFENTEQARFALQSAGIEVANSEGSKLTLSADGIKSFEAVRGHNEAIKYTSATVRTDLEAIQVSDRYSDSKRVSTIGKAFEARGIQFETTEYGALLIKDKESQQKYVDLIKANDTEVKHDEFQKLQAYAADGDVAKGYIEKVEERAALHRQMDFRTGKGDAVVYEFDTKANAASFANSGVGQESRKGDKPVMEVINKGGAFTKGAYVVVTYPDGQRVYEQHFIDGGNRPSGATNTFRVNPGPINGANPKEQRAYLNEAAGKVINHYETEAKIKVLGEEISTQYAEIEAQHDSRRLDQAAKADSAKAVVDTQAIVRPVAMPVVRDMGPFGPREPLGMRPDNGMAGDGLPRGMGDRVAATIADSPDASRVLITRHDDAIRALRDTKVPSIEQIKEAQGLITELKNAGLEGKSAERGGYTSGPTPDDRINHAIGRLAESTFADGHRIDTLKENIRNKVYNTGSSLNGASQELTNLQVARDSHHIRIAENFSPTAENGVRVPHERIVHGLVGESYGTNLPKDYSAPTIPVRTPTPTVSSSRNEGLNRRHYQMDSASELGFAPSSAEQAASEARVAANRASAEQVFSPKASWTTYQPHGPIVQAPKAIMHIDFPAGTTKEQALTYLNDKGFQGMDYDISAYTEKSGKLRVESANAIGPHEKFAGFVTTLPDDIASPEVKSTASRIWEDSPSHKQSIADAERSLIHTNLETPTKTSGFGDVVKRGLNADVSGGTSLGMSAYGMYNRIKSESTQQKLEAGGDAAFWTKSAFAADGAAIGVDLTQISSQVIRASSASSHMAGGIGRMARVAGPAGMLLATGAGVFDFQAACAVEDYDSAIRAAGRTTGGLVGGVAGGVAGGATGGVVGGAVGGAVGSTVPVAGTTAGAITGAAVGTKAGATTGAISGGLIGSKIGEEVAVFADKTLSSTGGARAELQSLVDAKTGYVHAKLNNVEKDHPDFLSKSESMHAKYSESSIKYLEAKELYLVATLDLSTTPEQRAEAKAGYETALQDFRRACHEVKEIPQLFNPESPDAAMYFKKHEQLGRISDETRELIGRVGFLDTNGDAEYAKQKEENIGKLSTAYNRIEEIRAIDKINGETISLSGKAQGQAEKEWGELDKLSEMRDSGELQLNMEKAAEQLAAKEAQHQEINDTLQAFNLDAKDTTIIPNENSTEPSLIISNKPISGEAPPIEWPIPALQQPQQQEPEQPKSDVLASETKALEETNPLHAAYNKAKDAGVTLKQSGSAVAGNAGDTAKTEENIAETAKPLQNQNMQVAESGKAEPDAVVTTTAQQASASQRVL